MKNSIQNVLSACIKSTEEVILPALAKSSSLEQQQGQTLLGHLRFLQQRVNLLGEEAQFELNEYRELGTEVLAALECHGQDDAALREALGRGRAMAVSASASRESILQITAELKSAVSHITRDLPSRFVEARIEIERFVFASGSRIIDFRRAWFDPQGWDPDRDSLTSLDHLFSR